MHVTMADLNKKANTIINQVAESGEAIMVYKHGKPIAEIRPYQDDKKSQQALDFLLNLEPVPVSDSIDAVLSQGRQRGL